jgi:ADP-ribosylglycohydrolase
MTDTPPDWVLIEAADRGGYHWKDHSIEQLREQYCEGDDDDLFRALCDMILKHEQKPVDRKLLCAREANELWDHRDEEFTVEDACVRAIELWEEGFGK